jgi:hypothetical protein
LEPVGAPIDQQLAAAAGHATLESTVLQRVKKKAFILSTHFHKPLNFKTNWTKYLLESHDRHN